jgi:hypothetical protein
VKRFTEITKLGQGRAGFHTQVCLSAGPGFLSDTPQQGEEKNDVLWRDHDGPGS